ncbi:sensor histidine kinase, partial [Aciditerrimonas ferrireducens]
MTLRTRLLLALLALLVVGLAVADVLTYTELRTYLVGQVDQQLEAVPLRSVARTVAFCRQQALFSAGQSCQVPLDSSGTLPPGDFAQLGGPGGVEATLWFGPPQQLPKLPADPPDGPFTASVANGPAYRVLAAQLPDGETVVVGTPLTAVDHDLGHLLLVEVLVSAGALVALGVAAGLIVRRGLRPLRAMAKTAGAIAGGDLSRRVDDADPRTEVGQLGEALNVMLTEIERAFAAQAASEDRLRRFLADASHELRTPLTSIRGYAELFDRGARDRPEDLAVAMGHIRSEAERMALLVEDLLLLARLDQKRPLERQPVELVELAQETVAAARAAHPDREVRLVHLRAAVQVEGDRLRLRQVLDNLVANALVHTPPESPVEVTVGEEAGWAVLMVADRGPGIPPEERQRIFEPFQRLDPSRQRATGGLGLGLAIVAALVRAHGGQVAVEDRPGGGALFRVRLPLLPAKRLAGGDGP